MQCPVALNIKGNSLNSWTYQSLAHDLYALSPQVAYWGELPHILWVEAPQTPAQDLSITAFVTQLINHLGQRDYPLARSDFVNVLNRSPDYTLAKEYYDTANIREILNILDMIAKFYGISDRDSLYVLKKIVKEKLLEEYMKRENKGDPPVGLKRVHLLKNKKGGTKRKQKRTKRKQKRTKRKQKKK